MYQHAIFADGRFLGSGERPPDFAHGRKIPPSSFVYICPTCGEAWARAIVPNARFWALTIPCRKHPSRFSVEPAGSLLLEWNREFNSALTPAAWQREVVIHLAHYDRFRGTFDGDTAKTDGG